MQSWLPLALITPLAFAVYQALSKLLPKGTSIYLVNAYASLIGLILMLALYLTTAHSKSLKLSPKAFLLAVLIGLLISIGNFGIIKAYSLGAPQSQFSALFYTTLIIYAFLMGLIAFHEKLHPLQVAGLLLAGTGLFLIAYFRK